jgi:hypothetical protein
MAGWDKFGGFDWMQNGRPARSLLRSEFLLDHCGRAEGGGRGRGCPRYLYRTSRLDGERLATSGGEGTMENYNGRGKRPGNVTRDVNR